LNTLLYFLQLVEYSSSPSPSCRNHLCRHLDWPRDRGRKEH
jgi:hypothetical protein